ncbi:MAG: hypothetical protein IJ809_04085 [Clostridia bacterium]|nr:hypothetical protein [Clostridia bacterium]
MDEFDKIMKKKYNEINVPDGIGKNIIEEARKRKLKKRNNVLKLVASLSIVLILTSVIYFTTTKKNSTKLEQESSIIANDNINQKDNVGNENVVLPVASRVVNLSNDSELQLYSEFKPDVISIVELDNILEYTNYSKIQNVYLLEPVTKLKVSVIKLIMGGVNNFSNIYIKGGIISEYDFEKSLNSVSKKETYGVKMSEEEKKNSYVEVVTKNSLMQAKPEVGKTYLVCLRKDDYNFEGYLSFGTYGFVEYDMETGMVKNVETGEWEEIDKSILDLDSLKSEENN